MPKVILTGGAGFIGSHVFDALTSKGYSVVIIDDLSTGRLENLPKNLAIHKLDIGSKDASFLIAKEEPDFIIHAAAQMSVRKSMEDPVFDAEVNICGLLNILESARKLTKIPHFVFLSTGGAIYGEQDIFPAPENHPLRPTSVYGLAKRVGELYLDLWMREYKLPFAALRLGNVYGPRQNPHGEAGVVAIFCEKLLAKIPATINGTGEQTRDFIYVGDVAKAIVTVCEKRITGTFNIGTGIETSVTELYDLIAKTVDSPAKPKLGPGKAGEQLRSSINASLAQKILAWRPEITLPEGLKITSSWFSKHRATTSPYEPSPI